MVIPKPSQRGQAPKGLLNVNKLTFITNTTEDLKKDSMKTEATFTDNTQLLSIGLVIGVSYDFTKNWRINADTTYRYDNYQVAYRNADKEDILNALTIKQDNYLFTLSIEKRF